MRIEHNSDFDNLANTSFTRMIKAIERFNLSLGYSYFRYSVAGYFQCWSVESASIVYLGNQKNPPNHSSGGT